MSASLLSKNNVRVITEKGLSVWAVVLLACHLFLATFQYVIYYQNFTSAVLWAGLGLLIVSGIYLLVSAASFPSFSAQLKERFLTFCTPSQLLLFALLLCYVVSCAKNQAHTDDPYFISEDWRLFDFSVCVFLLFPFAKIFGKNKRKKLAEFLMHIVLISYSAFTLFALWHIFHLEVLDLPSGSQAGMTAHFQLLLGRHYNLTGMLAATMFCLCVYMIITQDLFSKIFYTVLAFSHLLVLYLSNCRTAFIGILVFVIFVAFFLPWTLLKDRKTFVRLLASILICAFCGVLFWFARAWIFILFENITHYSSSLAAASGNLSASAHSFRSAHMVSKEQHYFAESLASSGADGMRKLTGLSNRTKVWSAALKVMFSSPSAFFFGVTPAGVTRAIWDIGGYHVEEVAHAHNIVLQVGASFGVPAMVIFVAFLSLMAFKSIRILIASSSDSFRYSYLFPAIILCFVIINMAESYLVGYFSVMGCFFFLFCGFIDSYPSAETRTGQIERIHSPSLINNCSAHPGILLFALFLIAVLFRFVFAVSFTGAPMITIDESLYTNIARSLATGEGIAYRSQPINYMYIFYPLLLVPLYLIPLPFDLYRTVQFYNTLLICSSLFPVYLFTKDFTGSRKKALVAGVITLLMADMQMATLLMSECVVWPLSLWLVYFAYHLFTDNHPRISHGLMVGLLTALLFWTKPGSIAMGIVFLLAALTLGQKQQVRRRLPAALSGCILCLVLIALFYALYVFVFGYDMSILGLYNKQLTQISAKWIAAVAEFSVLQLLLFAVSCGCVFFVVPYACYQCYKTEQKSFIVAFIAGLIISAVGTAAFVDMYKWNESFINPQLHLRYLAMYIPVMVSLSLAVPAEKWKSSKLLIPSLLVLSLFILFPGVKVGFVEGSSTYMDSFALSAYLNSDSIPFFVNYAVSAITVIFLLILCYLLYHKPNHPYLFRIALAFFACLLICHNISGYVVSDQNKLIPPDFAQDAREVNEIVENSHEEILGVMQQQYDEILTYWLESRIRKPLQQVTVDCLTSELEKTDGVYLPFIPDNQAPNINNRLTPQTSTFLLGSTVAQHVELNPELDINQTQNSWFTLVHVPEGMRFFDTALFNMKNNTLGADEQATLVVFDESRYDDGKLTLAFYAYSNTPGAKLSVELDGVTMRLISLATEQDEIYRISMPKGQITLTAIGGDVIIPVYLSE